MKELNSWNPVRVKQELTGQPAPNLTLTDMQGKPLTLASFKGKIVLLDF